MAHQEGQNVVPIDYYLQAPKGGTNRLLPTSSYLASIAILKHMSRSRNGTSRRAKCGTNRLLPTSSKRWYQSTITYKLLFGKYCYLKTYVTQQKWHIKKGKRWYQSTVTYKLRKVVPIDYYLQAPIWQVLLS